MSRQSSRLESGVGAIDPVLDVAQIGPGALAVVPATQPVQEIGGFLEDTPRIPPVARDAHVTSA